MSYSITTNKFFQRANRLLVGTIGKSNKMADILSTIFKPNTIRKQNRPLPLEFPTCTVFQPPMYCKVWVGGWVKHAIGNCFDPSQKVKTGKAIPSQKCTQGRF